MCAHVYLVVPLNQSLRFQCLRSHGTFAAAFVWVSSGTAGSSASGSGSAGRSSGTGATSSFEEGRDAKNAWVQAAGRQCLSSLYQSGCLYGIWLLFFVHMMWKTVFLVAAALAWADARPQPQTLEQPLATVGGSKLFRRKEIKETHVGHVALHVCILISSSRHGLPYPYHILNMICRLLDVHFL